MQFKALIMDGKAMVRSMTRISHEIIEHNKGIDDVIIVGIHSRGVPLAEKIAERINVIEGKSVSVATLDITKYRDDISQEEKDLKKTFESTLKGFDVKNKHIVLVDDVLYTGRTVRAALDAVMDIGRPLTIQLAVLVDRGHRELPIRPDYVGKNVPTSSKESVKVHLKDVDGTDEVVIYSK
ncbi:bifunctional pyr operon transcriptional regulator/uracil phosphoribosyltransferase PyrR [Acidaminobacter sp. JC074]|uniref:bifunctional pyr operon transcriptional regulator/uracil phosphoribosyltransferase PyrR n=1 Tax=Acidaminobacter sp. JC074 TaxID=2530199 RepID=UPI001F0EF8CB|nr:bifunctional pyr operon transcriptional regulator/uracil phosphoribosyltransferase PyrR [Acidaminobacter sp. JC074]MCH4890239.1 bifunctional pyr operon transcriptional regulator/uracil phosphoribosyltransferase PyrR [Acidaminobacter sp. JC074]